MDYGWQKFLVTGKVEDYLRFKMKEKEENSRQNPKGIEQEKEDTGAGDSKRNGHSTWQFPGR